MNIISILGETAIILSNYRGHATTVDLYNEGSGTHEVNLVHCFVLAAQRVLGDAIPFFEVGIDTGRIDLVLVAKEMTIILEAKSKVDWSLLSKLREITDQLERVQGSDHSLKDIVNRRIPSYRKERWGIDGDAPLYAVGLAYCSNPSLVSVWEEKAQQVRSLERFQRGCSNFKQGAASECLLYLYARSSKAGWV